ncbi:MAG: flagellar hook-associated protein FlgK [Armatimonadetes bacterium]|nr:flagellar hook-associated protein FlgK [Armatimonadota bacterium]
MPSAFHGIDIAARALRSFQRGLDVTGHNIANVNTPGYSRQAVDFKPTDPLTFYLGGSHALGTGVTVGSVNRIRDAFLERRRSTVMGDLGRMDTLSSQLSRVEGVFTDLQGSGISQALNAFFDAWSGLASNPSNTAMRFQVQTAGRSLALQIRSAYLALQSQKQEISGQIQQTFDTIDQLSSEISRLNAEIRSQTALGASPNDLLDQRDLAVQKLSEQIGIVTYRFEDGTVQVYSGQFTLVDSLQSHPIPRTFDSSTNQLSNGTQVVDVRTGALRGYFDSYNKLSGYQEQLDTLADTLRSEVNAIHATGVTQENPPRSGLLFFNDTPNGAIDFDLSAEVQASQEAIATGTTGKAGDGGIALELSRLRDKELSGLGGWTFSGYYANLAAEIGRDVQHASNEADSFRAVLDQIDLQRQSISGVSLDDEMANMLRFQRSYQAAARMLSVFNQMTEDLIDMFR